MVTLTFQSKKWNIEQMNSTVKQFQFVFVQNIRINYRSWAFGWVDGGWGH